MTQKRRKEKTLAELQHEADGVIRSTKLLIAWINASVKADSAYIAGLER